MSDFLALQELTAVDLNQHFGLFARKPADETVNNSSTFQDDDHLALSVLADTTYELSGQLRYFSGTTPDMKCQWTYPSGLTMFWNFFGLVGSWGGFSLTEAGGAAFDGVGADRVAHVGGIVIVGSTAGTLQFQWAQNTANASDTVMREGSYISLRKVS